jgi:hypothetical protein
MKRLLQQFLWYFHVVFGQWGKELLSLVGIFALVCLGMFLLKAREAAEQLRAASAELTITVAKSNDALFKQYGLADEARKTLVDVHRAAGEAAIAERDYYTRTLQPQTFALFSNLNAAITGLDAPRIGADVHGTLANLNQSLDQLPPLITSATGTLDALHQAISDVDKNLLNDPDVAKSLNEISSILGNVKLTTDEVLPIVQKIRHLATDPPTKKAKLLGILQFVYETVLIKAALGK